MAEVGPAHLSIGEVLGLLLEEFPDVTISKIRFLESQGLIEPERTPSGYRKFFDDDVELLRLILREQREKFLPLRVIKDRLDSGEIEPPDPTPTKGSPEPERPSPAVVSKHPSTGRVARSAPAGATEEPTDEPPAPTPPSEQPTPPTKQPALPTATTQPAQAAQPAPTAPAAQPPPAARLLPGVLVNRQELCAMASVTFEELAELEEYGVVAARGSELYGDEAVEIAAAAGGFLRAGVDARHLRAWRTSAEREAGLYEQLILPVLRQRNPQARSHAATRLDELETLGSKLRAAMMRSVLRRYLEL